MNDKPITVLLIEDNPGDARLIREILAEETSARFQLEHAETLASGLARLDAGSIDVILIDLSLPDSHGIGTFHEVCARSPRLPIIVLTSLDDEAIAGKTLTAGGQDYLVKTYLNYAILHRAICHAIDRKRPENDLRRDQQVELAMNRAHDEFLAVRSQELRASLAPVLSRLGAQMADPATPPDLLPCLGMIREHLGREERLLDDLRNLVLAPRGR